MNVDGCISHPASVDGRRYQEQWGLRARILGSLAVCTSTLVACGVLVLMEGASSAFLFFSTCTLIFASGLAVAVLQVMREQKMPPGTGRRHNCIVATQNITRRYS